MKRRCTRLIHLSAGAALGFMVGSVAGKMVTETEPASSSRRHSAAAPVTAGPAGNPTPEPEALPSVGDFREMPAAAKLELADGFGSLSRIRREAFLNECAGWPEPESTQMLRLLLSRWAETDPGAALEWAFRHLEGRALDCFSDLAQVWAARDVKGFAAWCRETLTREGFSHADGVRVRAPFVLARFDPLAMAEFLELAASGGFSHYGIDISQNLRTPGAVRAMAEDLHGHVEYIADLEELDRQLAGKSTNPRNKRRRTAGTRFSSKPPSPSTASVRRSMTRGWPPFRKTRSSSPGTRSLQRRDPGYNDLWWRKMVSFARRVPGTRLERRAARGGRLLSVERVQPTHDFVLPGLGKV